MLHITNVSTQQTECVFKYFLNAALTFTLSALRNVTLGGKLLQILMQAQSVLFGNNDSLTLTLEGHTAFQSAQTSC
jgi:hypothetical protein